nr:hypothetical protein [Cohnella mopanensis]
MESSCSLLIRLIGSRDESWSISELMKHPDLVGLSLEISVLLQKLVHRGSILEIAKPSHHFYNGILELRYASASGKTNN